MTESRSPRTEADLAKKRLLQAWFESKPNQPMPEGRAQVEKLFAAIEAEAAAPRSGEGLDVETLAKALCAAETARGHVPTWDGISEAGRDLWRKDAEKLATEYVRLRENTNAE